MILVGCSAIILGITSISCKRSFDREFDGMAICPSENFVASNFAIKSTANSSNTQVNLTSTTATILANFNESVAWTVEIKGQTSGAFKSFKGTSNQINIIWSGEPDSAPFFKIETITAVLKINCKSEVYGNTQIDITGLPSFSSLPGYISNMDPSSPRGGLDNTFKVTSKFMDSSLPGYAPSPEGGSYLNMVGNSTVPEWYFGQYNNVLSTGIPGLNLDPSTVYYNVYLKGMPGSQAQIIFSEDVPGSSALKARKVNFDLSSDWKMYTVKLSDIGIVNPRDIKNINTNLGCSPVQSMTGLLDMDLVIFTNDAPLLK